MVEVLSVWTDGCSDAIPYIDITGGCDGPIPSRNRPPDAPRSSWRLAGPSQTGRTHHVEFSRRAEPDALGVLRDDGERGDRIEAERGAEEEAVEANRFTAPSRPRPRW